MSTLARFKKPGGFAQLVHLIESCDAKKKESLLKVIETEDPTWAKLVKEKMLNIDMVMGWQIEITMEIVPHIPEKVLAVCMKGFKPEYQEKVYKCLPAIKQKTFKEMVEMTQTTPGQIESAYMSLLKKVRELDQKRIINIEKINPNLTLELEKKVA